MRAPILDKRQSSSSSVTGSQPIIARVLYIPHKLEIINKLHLLFKKSGHNVVEANGGAYDENTDFELNIYGLTMITLKRRTQ